MHRLNALLALLLFTSLLFGCGDEPPTVGTGGGSEFVPGQKALEGIEEKDRVNAPRLGDPSGEAAQTADSGFRGVEQFGGRHASSDGASLFCTGVVACSQSCASDDARCVDGCVDQGSFETGQAAQSLAECACDDEACTNCEYEAMTCYLDGTELGCGGFVDCVATCGSDDCSAACLESLGVEGAAYLDSLTQCMNDYCEGDYCEDCRTDGERCLQN